MWWGTVSAALQLLAQAGNDINVVTTTRTTSGGTAQNGYSNTVFDRVAGLAVTGPLDADLGQGGVMSLNAGNDINLQAAQITNAVENGVTRINAGNDVNLSTLNISTDNRITWDPKTICSLAVARRQAPRSIPKALRSSAPATISTLEQPRYRPPRTFA